MLISSCSPGLLLVHVRWLFGDRSAKPWYHATITTRIRKSFKQHTQSFHSVQHRPLLANCPVTVLCSCTETVDFLTYLRRKEWQIHFSLWFVKQTKNKSRVSVKVDITLPNARQWKGIESLVSQPNLRSSARRWGFPVTRCHDSDLKQFYLHFLISCHVAVVKENVCCLRCLIENLTRPEVNY